MNAGIPQLIVKDVTLLMERTGFLLPDGTYDQTKLDTWEENLAFVAGLQAIGQTYGLTFPPKVGQVIQLLPLLAAVLR